MENNNKKSLENRKRTLSRLVALQIFYQFEFFDKKYDIDKIKDELIDNYVLFEGEEPKSYRNKIDEKLINKLLAAMPQQVEKIDEDIISLQANSKELVDFTKQIIRFGALELQVSQDLDFKIIVSEYVDIAAYFVGESKLSFINSILNNLAKKYREIK